MAARISMNMPRPVALTRSTAASGSGLRTPNMHAARGRSLSLRVRAKAVSLETKKKQKVSSAVELEPEAPVSQVELRRRERLVKQAERDRYLEDNLEEALEKGHGIPWGTMFRYMDGKVEGITPEETHALVSAGKATLLDVRSKDDGASDVQWMNPGFFIAGTMRDGTPEGAVNVPLFQLIGGQTLYKQVRRIAFSYVFGVLNGQEVRREFFEEVEELIPDKNKLIVVMCDAKYPTMQTAIGRETGIRSRSLQATYYLMRYGGYKNVKFMEGGFVGWDTAGMPVNEFNDPNAQPFAQRNLPKMASILSFLLFVTAVKSGLVFIPILIFAPDGALADYGFTPLEEVKQAYLATFHRYLW